MIRGTTAQFKFKLPCIKGRLKYATVKFWQDGNAGTIEAKLPITKRLDDCTAIETDTQKVIDKWNSGEYEDIKEAYNLSGTEWGELTDEKRRQFAWAIYDELCITLKTEETLIFSDKLKAKVQLRAAKLDGTTFASQQQLITVEPIIDDIVYDDPSEVLPNEEDGFIILDGFPIA